MSEAYTPENGLDTKEVTIFSPVDFESYRNVCDSQDDFRKIGIQDEDAFSAVLEDDRTVFFLHNGVQVPLLAPADHEKMYNLERCKDLTKKNNIMLLAVPLDVVLGSRWDNLVDVPEDTAILVEEFGDIDEESITATADNLPFRATKSQMFVNPNLVTVDGHDHAWMSAYSLSFEPKEGHSGHYDPEKLLEDVVNAWQSMRRANEKNVSPEAGTNDTYLFTSDQLRMNKEIIDKLWSIAEIGFGDVLGAHHPLSMEFTRDFFDEQVSSTDTLTTVKFIDGEPVCFGFLALGMENNDWINTDSTKIVNELKDAKQKKRPYVHFHELISGGEKGMGHSVDILTTFLGAAARTGYQYDVFFESTNLSSLYIPKIVENEIRTSDDVRSLEPIKQLGKLSYWALLTEEL